MLQKKIDIMSAYADGTSLEFRSADNPKADWVLISKRKEPSWNWELYDYRIAPPEYDTDWRTINRGTPIVVCREQSGLHRILSYDRFSRFDDNFNIVTDHAELFQPADVTLDYSREIIWFEHNHSYPAPTEDLDLILVDTKAGYFLNQSALIVWNDVKRYRVIEKSYNISNHDDEKL